MKSLSSSPLVLVAAMTVTALASAQQPPDVVKSDSSGNTAAGTSVLVKVVTNSQSPATNNTGVGLSALSSTTTGDSNTAVGALSLSGGNGDDNTAVGANALQPNSGSDNTAMGYSALALNTTGTGNTAIGSNSLSGGGNLSTGQYNTAVGTDSLYSQGSGSNNVAIGAEALFWSSTGSFNTAVGSGSLHGPALMPGPASNNTAVGYNAVNAITTGTANTAVGMQALIANTTGSDNTVMGYEALYRNTGGRFNIAIGYQAEYASAHGDSNIIIGNTGAPADNATIKIGTQGTQTSAFMAGIAGTPLTGSQVIVTSSGQLGVLASSERYKTAIATMGTHTDKLNQLRPVSFQLKADPTGTLQYGLIAEEVDKVYPELVIRDADGHVQGVRYDELAPMLLNEMQRQKATLGEQADKLKQQDAQLRCMQQEMAELKRANESTQAALDRLMVEGQKVAMR